MRLSSARRRCMVVLQDVELPDPFDLGAFCDSLAAQRGRRLYLHPFHVSTTGPLPCGVYLSLRDDDHIFFDGRTSPLHRNHIVLHEISHMLLGHGTDSNLHETIGRLTPLIDQRTIETMLGRTSYSTDHEQQAELLATLIAGSATSRAAPAGDTEAAPTLSRLQTTLGHVASKVRDR
jgi:hypothetical protein